ncbi:MAG: YezD family protein [Candidatus Omnitrophica bacterium]|nr:YezD family protein [Candidatus Omnitrophota bacterium]
MMVAEQPSAEVMGKIVEAIRGVRFGSVQIVIHDSQVVQIEKAEKIRFGVSSTRTDRTSGGPQQLPEGRMS